MAFLNTSLQKTPINADSFKFGLFSTRDGVGYFGYSIILNSRVTIYIMLLLLLSHLSCLTLCDPIDSSPPVSFVPGILQARILEWVAISFSNACMHAKSLQSCPALCNPMDTAHQAPLSMGFSRQEYWSGLPYRSPIYIIAYTDCIILSC